MSPAKDKDKSLDTLIYTLLMREHTTNTKTLKEVINMLAEVVAAGEEIKQKTGYYHIHMLAAQYQKLSGPLCKKFHDLYLKYVPILKVTYENITQLSQYIVINKLSGIEMFNLFFKNKKVEHKNKHNAIILFTFSFFMRNFADPEPDDALALAKKKIKQITGHGHAEKLDAVDSAIIKKFLDFAALYPDLFPLSKLYEMCIMFEVVSGIDRSSIVTRCLTKLHKILETKVDKDSIVFDKSLHATKFHLGKFESKDPELLNVEFLEYCFSNEYIDSLNGIMFPCGHLHSGVLHKIAEEDLTWSGNINALKNIVKNNGEMLVGPNKFQKQIKQLEFFFDNKVLPTKNLFSNMIQFFWKILNVSYGNISSSYYSKSFVDITPFVQVLVNYSYKLTVDDIVLMGENHFYINNVSDYDINLADKKYYDFVARTTHNIYNIVIPCDDTRLQDYCKNAFKLVEFKKIMSENSNTKPDIACLMNLCKKSDLNTIKYVVEEFKVKPTMEVLNAAVTNGRTAQIISYLFKFVYDEYLENKKSVNVKDTKDKKIIKEIVNDDEDDGGGKKKLKECVPIKKN